MKPLKFLFFLCAATVATLGARAAEYPSAGADVYDPTGNGEMDVARALRTAKAESKHVLLDFGANWCPWCHKLHATFTQNADVKAQLEKDYVVVYIDVNMRKGIKRNATVNAKYGNPIKEGLPVLVVLDADDHVLVTQETGALEDGDRHSPEKIVAFLKQWAPKR